MINEKLHYNKLACLLVNGLQYSDEELDQISSSFTLFHSLTTKSIIFNKSSLVLVAIFFFMHIEI